MGIIKRKPKISYIVTVFPSTSATFVLNEILQFQQSGFDPEIFSFHKKKEIAHSEQTFITHYFPDVRDSKAAGKLGALLEITWANLFIFLMRPKEYVSCVNDCLKNGKAAGSIFTLMRAGWIAKKLRTSRTDIIHAQFSHNPTLAAYFVNKLLNIPYIFTSHAYDIFKKEHMLEKKIENSVTSFTISDFNKKFIENKLKDSDLSKKVVVNRCGVNIRDFYPSREQSGGTVNILSIGRLVPKKGFGVLVKALKSIEKDHCKDFICRIVGDGPDREMLESQIANSGLSGKIKLLGAKKQNEIKEYLSSSDMFVLPCIPSDDGDMDGIPVVLMEAMASGIPVISTSLSGIPELVIDGKTGLLCEPGDEYELATKIMNLIDSRKLRDELGIKARDHVIKNYDLEKNFQEKIKYINEYLKIAW